MNRKLIVGGCVGAVVLLALTMFPSVVSTNVIKEQNIHQFYNNCKCELKEFLGNLEESWIPGSLIGIFVLVYAIFAGIGQFILDLLWNWSRS